MIVEKHYFRTPLVALLTAFFFSACTDYAEQYEGDYKAEYGDAEAFERNLNDVSKWGVDVDCQSDDYVWEWCFESDGKYAPATFAGASWESFVKGEARLVFSGTNNSGQNYSTNLLTEDNVLHVLRRNGGLRVEVADASGSFSAGVQVKLKNSELYKSIYPGMFVSYTNECADAFVGLKYIDGDGKVVSEYRWDKLSVGEQVGSLLSFDELNYASGERDSEFLKKANTFEIGLSSCSDTHKGVVIYAVAVMHDSKNEDKSSSSEGSSNGGTTNSNGGAGTKSSSSVSSNGSAETTSSSSSAIVTPNSSEGTSNGSTTTSSSSVTSNGSTTTSSSVKSSSSEAGFLWRGGVDKSDIVKTDFARDKWYFYKADQDDTKLLRPQSNPYDICYGYCGKVYFGEGYVDTKNNYVAPYGNVSILVNNGEEVDVSDKWNGGICITYASDRDSKLYIALNSEDENKTYEFAMPEYVLSATTAGNPINIEQVKWDQFKQPDWASEKGLPGITGTEVSKKLRKIQVNFDGSYGMQQNFNIYEIGSYGKCGKQDPMKEWNQESFEESLDKSGVPFVEPYPTAIDQGNLLWYAGNKLKNGSSYLVNEGFEYEKPWLSDDAKNGSIVEWKSPLYEGNDITDKLIVDCGGAVCGTMKSFSQKNPIIGFNVPKKDVKEWGGICLTYKANAEGMMVYLGISDEAEAASFNYDWYRVLLQKNGAGNRIDTCYAWSDFIQGGWGRKRIEEYLPKVDQIVFTTDGIKEVDFSLVAIGKYPAEKGGNDFFAWDFLNPQFSYNEFTDSRDGRKYKYLKIGNYEWMAENMNIDRFNGLCANNDPKNCAKYGRLYPPNEAVCPSGWRLPNITDFEVLKTLAEEDLSAGVNLMSLHGWKNADGADKSGVDKYGFSATPGGYADSDGKSTNLTKQATFWGTQNETEVSEYDYMIVYYTGDISLVKAGSNTRLSIRCVRGSIYDGNKKTLTDLRDDKVYKTVEIGDQIWMAENLNYAYPGGTENEIRSSFCYSNKADSCTVFGRLYLRSAAMDSAGLIPGNKASDCGYKSASCTKNEPFRGACPDGWHLPNSAEWTTLFNFVKGTDDSHTSGKKLKSKSGWMLNTDTQQNPNGTYFNGSDEYGFTALPAGYLVGDGPFNGAHQEARFWQVNGCVVKLNNYSDEVSTTCMGASFPDGYSVRCLKDN